MVSNASPLARLYFQINSSGLYARHSLRPSAIAPARWNKPNIRYTHSSPLNKPIPLIIDGHDTRTETTFPVVSPLTGQEVWSTSSASPQHADDAVAAAQRAFPAWSRTKPSERRDIFLRAADRMVQRKDELAEYMRVEIGATADYQDFILGLAIEGLKDTAGRIAPGVQGYVPESMHKGMRAMVWKRPYGVVLGIAPWNAPYHLGLRAVTSAIAAGNTTVLKGSELSPRCYWAFTDVLREAGLPDGCLNLLFHRPADAASITEGLVAHPHVKKVNFTGSTKVGSIIAATAGRHLKPVLMELGGKASALVLTDADLKLAAQQCMMGAFVNSGQICMSTERILVHSSVADEFQSILADTIRQAFGPDTPSPVLVTAQSAQRNRDLVTEAVSKGARVLCGTAHVQHVDTDVAAAMAPTIVGNVDKSMSMYGTESFGPSVSLFIFDTEDEALALANDTEYGLAASVFTRDLNTAFRISERLESGAVHINSMTVHDEFGLPHGGVKKSGFGRFNGAQGLDEFLYTKSVTWME